MNVSEFVLRRRLNTRSTQLFTNVEHEALHDDKLNFTAILRYTSLDIHGS